MSKHRGIPFIFLASQRISNVFASLLSVFRVCYMCSLSFVRLRQMTRFYISPIEHTQLHS